jgi:UDP-N-acetyl-D-glucosamine dehydrogenase
LSLVLSDIKTELLEKISTKTAVVGIIGMGYVGLPLLHCFVEKGFRSIGFDVDLNKVEALQNGRSYIKHISSERIQNA